MTKRQKPRHDTVVHYDWIDGRYRVSEEVVVREPRRRGQHGAFFDTGLGGNCSMDRRLTRVVRWYVAGAIGYEFALEKIERSAGCSNRTARVLLRDLRPQGEAFWGAILHSVEQNGLYSIKNETMRMVIVHHILDGGARKGPLRDLAARVIARDCFSLLDG